MSGSYRIFCYYYCCYYFESCHRPFLYVLLLSLLQTLCTYLQLYTRNKPCFQDMQCCSCSVFTVCATCNVITPVKYALCFYISTTRSMCVAPNMAVFSISLISCLPFMLLRYCLSDFEMIQSPLLLLVSPVPAIIGTLYYYYRISHFSALAGKYSPILGCGNQHDQARWSYLQFRKFLTI